MCALLWRLQVELRRIEDDVFSISESLKYLKSREEEMRYTNESTNARVLWYSMFGLVILVGLGSGQLYFLRRFLETKNILRSSKDSSSR